jgi:hypothetical protein
MTSLRWSAEQLKSGVRSDVRHDGNGIDDELRRTIDKHGASLGFTGAVTWIKGDWAEVSHTLAMPSVGSKHCPCPFCSCTSETMHTRNVNFDFPTRDGTYEDWCRVREHKVTVDSEESGSIVQIK